MKKLALLFLFVLGKETLLALPVGNPADASLLRDGIIWQGLEYIGCDSQVLSGNDPCLEWCPETFSMRIGFYGDYVWNRDMQIDVEDFYAHIEESRISTNAFYLAINACERIDLFGTLGTTNLYFNTNVSAFAVPGLSGQRVTIETDTAFSWSVGTRITVWRPGRTIVGLEAQYFVAEPEINRVTFAELASEYPSDIKLRYQEWQVGLGIAYQFDRFAPYAAMKWAHAMADLNDGRAFVTTTPLLLHDLDGRKPIGYALGISLLSCEKSSLCVEWRFADEKALYVNGQIRF